ncbi:MAG: head GIN domain-containing protein [Candidatus Zixiibacteriota bacterium]
MRRRLFHTWPTFALIMVLAAQNGSADNWSVFGRRGERGSGEIVTEERNVHDFERIRLLSVADLRVVGGDMIQLKVTTDDNLLDNIVTEVGSRHTLVIDNEGSFSTTHGVLVEITMPYLTLLEAKGSGDVDLLGLRSDVLEIEVGGSGNVELDGEIKYLDISVGGSGGVTAHDLMAGDVVVEIGGSGDVELLGSTRSLKCAVHGSGEIDASELKAERVVAKVYGSGDISVHATASFDGAIYGSGDIDLFGNPDDIDRHVAGSGKIRRRR